MTSPAHGLVTLNADLVDQTSTPAVWIYPQQPDVFLVLLVKPADRQTAAAAAAPGSRDIAIEFVPHRRK